MKVSIVTSKLQAEHLNANDSALINSVSYEQHNDEADFYNVTIVFNKFCSIDLIAQMLFSAGISYGLDLKYSSYGTEPSR